MANTLKQLLEYSKANPNSSDAKNLRKSIARGDWDSEAQQEGVDLSPLGRNKPLTFGERLKMSFGDKGTIEELKRREEQAGLRGKLDVGDIADVVGSAIPVITSTIGGTLGSAAPGVGTALGIAGGTAAGETIKRGIGQALGVREEKTLGEEALGVVGQTAGSFVLSKGIDKAFNLATKYFPEKLMSTIFKQSADDIMAEVKSGGKNLTQAQEVLEEGFKGDAKTMMNQAQNTIKASEEQAQKLVTGTKLAIKNKSGYIKLISDYIDDLSKTSYGFANDVVTEGSAIIEGLKRTAGNQIDGQLALQTRRFIDGVRRTSSFKMNPNLSPSQMFYKEAADSLRKELSKQIPGLKDVMRKYAININAFEDLAKYAARTQNKELIDLLDVFILQGINPSAAIGRHLLLGGPVKTNIAQGLYQGGKLLESQITPGMAGAGVSLLEKGASKILED